MDQATYRAVDAYLLQEVIAAVTEQDGIMSFLLGARGKYYKIGVNYNGIWTNPTGDTVESLSHKLQQEISRASRRGQS